jgi:hypothetical protein
MRTSATRFSAAVIIILASLAAIFAQVSKNTSSISQLWTGYFNQTRLSRHWGLWADLHLRTKEDFASNFSQSITARRHVLPDRQYQTHARLCICKPVPGRQSCQYYPARAPGMATGTMAQQIP